MGQKLDADASPGIKLLRIYRYLMASKGRHYQSELAEKFQCSPQTVIRIMGEIEFVLGPMLETGIESRRKWYKIRAKGSLDDKGEFEEIRYLSLCRDMAKDVLPGQILGRIDDTIQNLATHMRSCYPAGPDSASPLFFLGKGRIDYDSHSDTISRLLEAIRHKRVCRIDYRYGDGEVECFNFAPACLLHIDEAVYAAGAILADCRELTNLAVHRILSIEFAQENFEIEFPDYSENMFGLPWHEPRKFVILFEAGETASFILERKWSDCQKARKRPDGCVELEIVTRSEEELRAWIRSFGAQARILSGPEKDAPHKNQ